RQDDKSLIYTLLLIFIASQLSYCQEKSKQKSAPTASSTVKYEVQKTDEEWKKQLTPEQYSVLREKETEYPFTGVYEKFNEKGTYHCAGCGQVLFESTTKYESNCGWPSFFRAANNLAIVEKKDTSYGMERIEILCSKCGGHLGHVFEDGPAPTGLRYCVNSVSLQFEGKKKE
ncbi:MAG: peptide-methionine (R)-S-oxide reductase MsrB, partial [Cyclobacteriaceae bacterium]|nr:peptide-methionine (R)-S-oxide reductase MsrB [Cyclobacteriaceae bacterium]